MERGLAPIGTERRAARPRYHPMDGERGERSRTPDEPLGWAEKERHVLHGHMAGMALY